MRKFGCCVEGTVADVGDLINGALEFRLQTSTTAFFKHDFIGGKVKVGGERQRGPVFRHWLGVRSIGREWAFNHRQLLLTTEECTDMDVPGWIATVTDGQKAVYPALWKFMSRSSRTTELKGHLALKGAGEFL